MTYQTTDVDFICTGVFGDDVPVVEQDIGQQLWDDKTCAYVEDKQRFNSLVRKLNKKNGNKKNQKQYKNIQKPKNISSSLDALPFEIISLIMDDLDPLSLDYFIRVFPKYRELFTGNKKMIKRVAQDLSPWSKMEYDDMFDMYTSWAIHFYNPPDSSLAKIRKYRAYCEVAGVDSFGFAAGAPGINMVPHFFNPIPTMFTVRTFNRIASRELHFTVHMNQTPLRTPGLVESMYDFIAHPVLPDRVIGKAFDLQPQCGSNCLCPIRSTCVSTCVETPVDDDATLAGNSSQETLAPKRLPFREKGANIIKKTLAFLFATLRPQVGEKLCPRGCTKDHTHRKFDDLKRLVEGAVQLVNPTEHPNLQSGRGFLSQFAPSVTLTHTVDSTVTGAVDSLTQALNSLTAAIPGIDDLEAAKQSVGKSLAPLGIVLPLVIVVVTGVIFLMRSSDRRYLVAITAVAGVLLLVCSNETLRNHISDLITSINNYVVSPATVTIQAGGDLTETATSFLVLFLSYYITGEVAEGNKLRVLFTKILPDMKKMKDGVTFAGNEVISLVQTGVNFVRTELLGIPAVSFTKTHKPEVDDWVESCMKCEAMFKDGKLKVTVSNANVVRHLLTRGRALVSACSHRKELQEVRDVLNLWLRVMEKMSEKFESSGVRAATVRQEPAAIMIAGGSAVGKTTLIKPFERAIAAQILTDFQLEEYRKNPDSYCYTENGSTGFKDGYEGQPIMIWDDAGQERDVAGNTDNVYFHFMQAKSIFPYKLHMASLDQKANTYFTSTCIIMTTNEQDFKPASINTHAALKRRFDLAVVVTPKPEYTDPKTLGDNLWARQLRPDIWKGTALDGEAPGFMKDIYQFHEYDYMTLQFTGRSFDFDGLVAEYIRIYRKFEAKHQRYMIDLENLLNEEIRKRPVQVQAGPLSQDAIGRVYGAAGRMALEQLFNGTGRATNHADDFGQFEADEGIENVRFDTRTGQFVDGAEEDYNSLELDEIVQWAGGQDVPLLASTQIDLPLLLPPINYDRAAIGRFLAAYNNLTDEQRDQVNSDFIFIIQRSVGFREGIESITTYVRELTWRRFGNLLVKAAERGFDALKVCLQFIATKISSVMSQGIDIAFKFDFRSFFTEFRAKLYAAWNWANTKYEELEKAYPNLVLVGKLLAAGSLIMAAAYMFWNSMPAVEEQSYNARNKRGNRSAQRLRTRAKAKTGMFAPDDVVTQAGQDQGVVALIEKCYSHSTYFMNYAHLFNEEHGMESLIKENGIDSVMSEFGTVLFVKETVAIMPLHFKKKLLAAIKEGYITKDSRMRLTRCTDHKIYYEFPVTCILNAEQVTAHEGRDIIAAQLPREILHHPDITDRFVSLTYLENKKSMCGILPVWRRGKQWCLSSFIAPRDSFEVKVFDETVRYRTLYEYYLNTRVGDCGAVLFLDDTGSGKQKILGIHTLGNGSYGCAAAITKEDIDLMMTKFTFVCKREEDSDNTYTVQSVITPGTGFVPLAKLDKPVFAADETKIVPSPLHGAWGPAKKAPAQLKSFEKDGTWIDPLVLAASKYGNSNVYVEPHLMKVAAEHYLGHLYGINKNNVPNPRTLTFDESICGIPGSEGVQAVNRMTSLGYPYTQNPVRGKPGKTRFLGHEGEIDVTSADYQSYITHITRIEKLMEEGTLPNFYGVDCKKDEKRELEKVSIGKTRLFVTFNFDHAVLMGRHFGAFFDWYGAMKIDNECAGGVNMYDATHLERIANRFKRFGGKAVFGDFSGFDTSFNTTVGWAIFDIIDLWYGDVGSRKIRLMLWLAAINSKHIIRDNLYKWDHGMPSGMRFTMYINTMTNCVNIRAAYTIIRGGVEHIAEFSEHVLPIVLGDDNGLAIHPAMINVLTQDAWTKAFAVIGYKYTMEDKKSSSAIGVRDFTECSFLKRTMRFDEDADRWVAQLDLDSILEPPYWSKSTSQFEDIVKSEVETALRELALYPKTVYDTWAPKIIRACETNMRWRPTVVDYKVNQQLVFKDICYC